MDEEFDIAAFRLAFPQFASTALYPDPAIQAQADMALCFIADPMCGLCNTTAWQLMTAHLLTINSRLAAGGGAAGQITSATIDKVSISITPPTSKDAYTYWLNTTPYGMQLAALLARCGAGGLYVGGLPERAAFRSVGGIFPRGGRLIR